MTTVTGRQTLTDMESALAELRREESALSDRLAQITDRIGLRRADEAAAFGDLARFKLEQGTGGLADRLDRASREARAAMERREAAIRALDADRNARTATAADAERELAAGRAELDAVETRIEGLAPEVDALLAADAAHGALIAAAEAAERVEEAAARKATQAEADLATKGKDYEADPLFTYLWKRQFGTAAYASRGLTRVLDRWVANLIGYSGARASYAVLT